MKKKTRQLAKKVGIGAGVVGGVVAAGYAAARLLARSRDETPAAGENERAADRALDFEPGSNFEYAGRDPTA